MEKGNSSLFSPKNFSSKQCGGLTGEGAPSLPPPGFVSSLSPFRARDVFVPPWVAPVETRVSQPLGLWSFESPRPYSGGGFSPPSPFGLWSVAWFFSFLGFLCFGKKTLKRGPRGGETAARVADKTIWHAPVFIILQG
jgi:hypothetical protein